MIRVHNIARGEYNILSAYIQFLTFHSKGCRHTIHLFSVPVESGDRPCDAEGRRLLRMPGLQQARGRHQGMQLSLSTSQKRRSIKYIPTTGKIWKK